MEVHHHPHVEKKSFKEYLLEGLMIFLAVTMGFIAENFREHVSDKSKEKEYLSSLVKELSYDTTEFEKVKTRIFYVRPLLDSLFQNIKDAPRYGYVLKGKWNTPINEMNLPYVPTMPTIEQLKSSGSMRLISNSEIVNHIIQYETLIKGTFMGNVRSSTEALDILFRLEDKLCDYSDFNKATDKNLFFRTSKDNLDKIFIYEMPILFRAPEEMNQLANSVVNYKAVLWGYYTNLNSAKEHATALMNLVRKKNDIE
jgi:hypothetical protein